MSRLLLVAALAILAGPDTGKASDLVDRHVRERWQDLRITPAGPADDAEFLRRITLDLAGSIPTADEVTRFLADPGSGKRAARIEELLASPAYAPYWAELWENILVGYDADARTQSRRSLYLWLRDECFAKNMPHDRMIEALVSARGVSTDPGPASFVLRHIGKGGGTIALASKVSRTFLSAQIQCAQCHDHPFDRYTQEDFYGVAAFFVRAKTRKADKENRQELYEAPKGDMSYGEGKAKKTALPVFFDGTAPKPDRDRREEFSRLMLENFREPLARTAVNRVWAHFFGRGIVHPLEDLSERYKPSHPALLDELAGQFAANGFDIKWLIRAIVNSRTYQLSSRRPNPAPAPKQFAHAATRALTPEQLFNALGEALGSPLYEVNKNKKDDPVAVAEAREQALRRFRTMFGNAESADLVEFDGTLPQALMLMNGIPLNKSIVAKNNRLDLILRAGERPEERLERLFLSVLSRPPRARELQEYRAHVEKAGNRRETYEDVAWVLLNSSEFLFNH